MLSEWNKILLPSNAPLDEAQSTDDQNYVVDDGDAEVVLGQLDEIEVEHQRQPAILKNSSRK